MNILGISAYDHDAAATLLRDGEIVAAAQEERFTRKRHDSRFPAHATRYCLEAGGIKLNDVDAVAFYDKPLFWGVVTPLSLLFKLVRRDILKLDYRDPKATSYRVPVSGTNPKHGMKRLSNVSI